MMAVAGLAPVWSGPPSADEIRALDQQRLLGSSLFDEEPADEDAATAKALLAQRSADEIATAFAKLYRQRLPAPEDVSDPGFATNRREAATDSRARERGPRSEPSRPEGGAWFRLNVGRNGNADPKWLLPMLCRRGGVTRQDIGAIRIFERETKVQISDAASRAFADAVRGTAIAGIRIEPAGSPGQGAPPDRKPHGRKPVHRRKT
jgi:ATP-dependent RNA helicase DeaD